MINENYEKLKKAISMIYGVRGTINISVGRNGEYFTNEDFPDLSMAIELLMEIKSSEQTLEQDEHAIAFAKLHKDKDDGVIFVAKGMSQVALAMRPQLNGKQVTEVIQRCKDEFEDHEPDGNDYIIMRIEFHADDVLGHGDEEYAYSGDE